MVRSGNLADRAAGLAEGDHSRRQCAHGDGLRAPQRCRSCRGPGNLPGHAAGVGGSSPSSPSSSPSSPLAPRARGRAPGPVNLLWTRGRLALEFMGKVGDTRTASRARARALILPILPILPRPGSRLAAGFPVGAIGGLGRACSPPGRRRMVRLPPGAPQDPSGNPADGRGNLADHAADLAEGWPGGRRPAGSARQQTGAAGQALGQSVRGSGGANCSQPSGTVI